MTQPINAIDDVALAWKRTIQAAILPLLGAQLPAAQINFAFEADGNLDVGSLTIARTFGHSDLLKFADELRAAGRKPRRSFTELITGGGVINPPTASVRNALRTTAEDPGVRMTLRQEAEALLEMLGILGIDDWPGAFAYLLGVTAGLRDGNRAADAADKPPETGGP